MINKRLERQKIERLLPWHAAGTLSRREADLVERADMRNLSFVHHVPSNSEEHEKDSDDDPNIDARHEGMK